MPLAETTVSEAVSVFSYGGETLATSYGANAVAFFGAGATVLVDPFVSPVQAAELDALLRARGAPPVTHVVLTHHHTDHALGASHFAARDAEVIAHREAVVRMAAEHPALIAERRGNPEVAALFEAAEPYVPSRVVAGGILLDVGGLRLDIFPPGPAHTPGDLCVYAPAFGVLVTGDLVSCGYHPNLEDADMAAWGAALELLHAMPFWILVPGHGPSGGREALETQIAYFDAAGRVVKNAIERKADPVAALRTRFPDYLLSIVLPDTAARLA